MSSGYMNTASEVIGLERLLSSILTVAAIVEALQGICRSVFEDEAADPESIGVCRVIFAALRDIFSMLNDLLPELEAQP